MTLTAALAARFHGTVVVVGVGNPDCGDDGAGCAVARCLRGAPGLHVIEAEEVPESFIGEIAASGPDVVVLVDAVELGAEPGSVAVVEIDALPEGLPGTHRTPLSLLAEVVRCRTGADVLLIAIQPRHLGFATTPSPEVAASAERVAGLISEAVRRAAIATGGPSSTRTGAEAPA